MPGTIDVAIPDWIELAAVLVSALSGALLAAKGHEFDVGGVAALALVAGLGGGIIRDVLLGQGAPAALRDERYLIAVLAATGLGFFFAGTLNQFQGLLIVLDAAALGLYSVVGADKADQAGLSGDHRSPSRNDHRSWRRHHARPALRHHPGHLQA